MPSYGVIDCIRRKSRWRLTAYIAIVQYKGRQQFRCKYVINYQHTYMCMLIVIRMIYILKK